MLNLEEISLILNEVKAPKEIYNEVIQKAEQLEAEKKEERAATKVKSKNEYVIMVRGDKALADVLSQGWVVQVPAETDNATIISRFQAAAGEHNAASKKKKNYITDWIDLFSAIKRKFTKAHNIHVKTKEAVQVIVILDEKVGEVPIA